MNNTRTLEYLYTLKKSLIEKAFDQPEEVHEMDKEHRYCKERYQCVDCFLWWAKTKEGTDFWYNLYCELENGQNTDN